MKIVANDTFYTSGGVKLTRRELSTRLLNGKCKEQLVAVPEPFCRSSDRPARMDLTEPEPPATYTPEPDECEHDWRKLGWNERSGSFVRECKRCGEVED